MVISNFQQNLCSVPAPDGRILKYVLMKKILSFIIYFKTTFAKVNLRLFITTTVFNAFT